MIGKELDRIVHSRSFSRSEKLKRFLVFLVDRKIHDEACKVKEYTLGVEVYGRGSSFDPRIDSIVRVEAHRLRMRLCTYYTDEGRNDPIVVDIPVGGYTPVFSKRRRQKNAEQLKLAGAPASIESISIAVLPFLNMAPDPTTRYVSYGLTEELTDVLANTKGWRVVARTSAWAFRGKGVDVRQIGKLLNVEAVHEGSVRRYEDKFRVTAQLSATSTGYHMWSHTYEREIKKDIFTIQSEVARDIADALKAILRPVITSAIY